jgi:AraC-like DNA-binding protein
VFAIDLLIAGPGYEVRRVRCGGEHAAWSPVEQRSDRNLVLTRHGRFRRRVDGVVSDIDPTIAYLTAPGEEEQFAHPAGGDDCTLVTLTDGTWRAVAGDAPGPVRSSVYVDAGLDLAHRRTLAAAQAGDAAYATTEELLRLLALAVGAAGAGRPSAPAERALAEAARGAIVADDPAATTLSGLARTLGVSPSRLSRAFTVHMGESLTRYRNRVRVGWALDRIEAGEPSLAVLAADLGFADQAHLTRTVRAHVGRPPVALRRLLTRSSGPSGG